MLGLNVATNAFRKKAKPSLLHYILLTKGFPKKISPCCQEAGVVEKTLADKAEHQGEALHGGDLRGGVPHAAHAAHAPHPSRRTLQFSSSIMIRTKMASLKNRLASSKNQKEQNRNYAM